MQARTIAYWVCTGLFCLVLTFSGLAHLLRLQPVAEGLANLGYPVYFLSILGPAKLLGVVALLAPRRPLLKEWAYAGFTFDLLGATASHAFAGDPLGPTILPIVVLGLGAASYLLRPGDRRLPGSVTFGDASAAAAPAAQPSAG